MLTASRSVARDHTRKQDTFYRKDNTLYTLQEDTMRFEDPLETRVDSMKASVRETLVAAKTIA